MKKILSIGLLTLCFAAISQERASAWINSRFGVGFNWSWQSGGNNLLWGLFRDGQPPAPCPMPGPPLMPGVMPGMMPGMMPGCPVPGHGMVLPGQQPVYGTNDFQFFGRNPQPEPNLGFASTSNSQSAGYHSGYQPASYAPTQHQSYYPNYSAQYPGYQYSAYPYSSYMYTGYRHPAGYYQSPYRR